MKLLEHENKILVLVLIIMALLLSAACLSSNALAVSETARENYKLTEGVTESTVYVTEAKKENVRLHILRINKGANASFKMTTKKYYKKNSTRKTRKMNLKKWIKKNWGLTALPNLVKGYTKSKDKEGEVIAAVNGDYYKKEKYNGATDGILIMEGNRVRITKGKPFFGVLKNGKCVIRNKNGRTGDLIEATGGHLTLVKKGKIIVKKSLAHPGSPRHPCQAIGITSDKTVVIVTIDGEEPTSLGASWYQLGFIMKQQGCKDAIMLDGGGSSSFMTKREKGEIVNRNTYMEGVARDVSSAILIVKKKDNSSAAIKGKTAVSMKSKKTYLKKDSDGLMRYMINGKAEKSGFVMVNGKSYLFDSKGRGRTKAVLIGDDEYLFVKGELAGCTDEKAGKIAIGYCGGDKSGKNLVYAYHYGDKVF